MKLERLGLDSVDWSLMDAYPDRLVYQTREWVEFVSDTQRAEPVVAALVEGSSTLGYFTGLVQRRFGVRILGSPMPGWTTAFMGFNLVAGVSRRDALDALVPFAFENLGCAHIEFRDRNLTASDLDGIELKQVPWTGIEVDLRGSEDEIWSTLRATCRTAIRKAEKQGVTVEEATGDDFAEDFYPQLQDVFEKQALVPPYGIERVQALIRHVQPSGRLLLLRARDADGRCIATGIFPGTGRTMHFLAGASFRESQHLRPNEALMWHAMRHWKARGAEACDLGFALSYKSKWGGHEVDVPFLRTSRFRVLSFMRDAAQGAHNARQFLRGRLLSGVHQLRRS